MECFQCKGELEDAAEPCRICHWSEPDYIPEDDPRFLVFYTLILRAEETNSIFADRLEPTSREFAMLEHGDQCRIDGVCWRITAKNREKQIFFVRGWKAGLTKNGRFVTVSREEDLVASIAEREEDEDRWEKERQEGEIVLKEARASGKFDLEHVEWMTEDDWDSMPEEQRDELHERYNSTME